MPLTNVRAHQRITAPRKRIPKPSNLADIANRIHEYRGLGKLVTLTEAEEEIIIRAANRGLR